MTEIKRKCQMCRGHKTLDQFYVNEKTGWIHGYCRECQRKAHTKYMRQYRVTHKVIREKKPKKKKSIDAPITCERCSNCLYMGKGEYLCVLDYEKAEKPCDKYKEKTK